MFSYGMSGAGKTFTLFGPDDSDKAWQKWSEPHELWGIFPRLAYDLFGMREQTWKFRMKYFQNVADVVRDLISSTGEEQDYNEGMKKDIDGFMDVSWCIAATLESWAALRETFDKADSRKTIAPTQFNPMSTCGHCILNLVVDKPKDDDTEARRKGRIYVCDLIGAAQDGDIFYASYKKIELADGSIEHKLLGPHESQKLTKKLQVQHQKANLSLSELAQCFMKMGQTLKKKIKGPRRMSSKAATPSTFLCKYLKDTMMQSQTYLFCAIRPEASYLKYTFSSLEFARSTAAKVPNFARVCTMFLNLGTRRSRLTRFLSVLKPDHNVLF